MSGADSLTLAKFANEGSVSNVETLIGNTAADTITYATQFSKGSDRPERRQRFRHARRFRQYGHDSRTSRRSLPVRAADTITLGAAISKGSIDLGSGSDKLTLGKFANNLTVTNVESIVGGELADTVTLGNILTTTDSINLGSGADKLTLGDFGNTGSISNVETIIGGSDADIITLSTQISKGSIDLGDGTDKPLRLATSPTPSPLRTSNR